MTSDEGNGRNPPDEGGSGEETAEVGAADTTPTPQREADPAAGKRRARGDMSLRERLRSGEGLTFFGWLRRTARLWGFLTFVALVLFLFRTVILPFLLALLVTYVLAPVLNALARISIKRRRLPRFVWLIVLYLALFGLGALFMTSFVPRVTKDLKRIAGEAPQIWDRARQEWVPRVAGWMQETFGGGMTDGAPHPAITPRTTPRQSVAIRRTVDGGYELQLENLNLEVIDRGQGSYIVRTREPAEAQVGSERIQTAIKGYVQQLVTSSQRGAEEVLRIGQKAVKGLLAVITTLILTLMISAFLLLDTERILGMFRSLVDPSHQQDFDNVVKLIDKGLSGAIRGQLLICVVNGMLTWVGLAVFEIKYAILLALLAGVMSLIPIFGSILSTIPIVIVALVSGEAGLSFSKGFLILIWIIGIHLIEANLLNPKIIGTAARIHPVIVIFSVVAGERTYGPLGALLAVPTVSAVQGVFIYVRRKVRETGTSSAASTSSPSPASRP